MAFDLQRPRYLLSFNGNDYELIGTMELIEQIEYAFKKNIVDICANCVEMPTYNFIKLLHIILSNSNHKIDEQKIKDIVWQELGIEDLTLIRLNIYAYLKICITKPNQRAEVSRKLGELINPREQQNSLGETIEGSV